MNCNIFSQESIFLFSFILQTVTGLEYAEKAESSLEDKPENWIWLARARMAIGICYGKLGLEGISIINCFV